MPASDLPASLRPVAAQLVEIATDERDIESASLVGSASDLLVGAGDLEAFLRARHEVGRVP